MSQVAPILPSIAAEEGPVAHLRLRHTETAAEEEEGPVPCQWLRHMEAVVKERELGGSVLSQDVGGAKEDPGLLG